MIMEKDVRDGDSCIFELAAMIIFINTRSVAQLQLLASQSLFFTQKLERKFSHFREYKVEKANE